ncbi:MucBP domain-containing protein, partial [Pediococcus parvulus]|uniref:MucBP domain-containing protein n=1 Tax=Pediococcus parvulus TaxID=54062 RepID=UPI0021A698A2
KPVAPSVELSGKYNETYSTKPVAVNGYTLSATPANAEGKYTDSTPAVTYVYSANAETVTVNYVDENGKPVASSVELSGKYNETYSTKPVAVSGYTLSATPANAEGKYTDSTSAVTYVYSANAETVTVNYVDENGKPVAPSVELSGKYNETYSTKPVAVNGYTLSAT